MNQILRIFKKDARRHYPEILISLVLLALFTRRQLEFWLESNESVNVGSLMFFQITRLITPILVLFWAFLIVRVVQTESLVGDRQWWTTKPYEWWKLLLAKLVFIFVFISIPLILVQLFLLLHAGYSIIPNFRGVLLMQLTLPLFIILFSLVLACLTRNLGQAMLGVGLVLVIMIAVSWLTSQLTRNTMNGSSKFSEAIQSFLTFGSVILVPIWQFARRKTWASRGTLVASFGVPLSFPSFPRAIALSNRTPSSPQRILLSNSLFLQSPKQRKAKPFGPTTCPLPP